MHWPDILFYKKNKQTKELVTSYWQSCGDDVRLRQQRRNCRLQIALNCTISAYEIRKVYR